MPDRYRVLHCAIAGIIAAAFVLMLASVYEARYGAMSSKQDKAQSAAQQQNATGHSYASDTAATAQEPPIAPDDYEALCKTPQGRERANLCQQWRVAEAAEQAVLFNAFQLGITGFGTVFLIYNLILVRRSTDAAVKANEINRQNFIEGNRSWISIENFTITETLTYGIEGRPDIASCLIVGSYKLRNRGNTPAFAVCTEIISRPKVMCNDDDVEYLRTLLPNGTGKGAGVPIPPNGEATKNFNTIVQIRIPRENEKHSIFISVCIGATYKSEISSAIIRETTQIISIMEGQEFSNTLIGIDYLGLRHAPKTIDFKFDMAAPP